MFVTPLSKNCACHIYNLLFLSSIHYLRNFSCECVLNIFPSLKIITKVRYFASQEFRVTTLTRITSLTGCYARIKYLTLNINTLCAHTSLPNSHYKLSRRLRNNTKKLLKDINLQRINTMASNPLTKVARQQESTWTALHKRISQMSYNYSDLFEHQVRQFVENKAISLGSSIGYFAPSTLTTTAFILANNGATIDCGTHRQVPNLFTMFVGYPGTGKSAAIDHSATTPLLSITEDEQNILMGRATSSALVKQLSKFGKAYVVSSEIYDVLHKLLKSDEETASGDVQLLCKLFSGERTTYHFSTEHTREIEANTPFAILGSTQMQNAAKLIARMDQGHGLMDRFLISVPLALRPTPEQQTDATNYINNFEEIFGLIQQIHQDNPEEYNFETEAIRLLQQMNSSFTADVNAAILDGVMPPKSKKSDLVPRIALALHVFTHATSSLLNGQPLEQCPTMISKQTLERAVKFVEHLELQKDALCQVKRNIFATYYNSPCSIFSLFYLVALP